MAAPTVRFQSEGIPLRGLRVEVQKGPDAGKTAVAAQDTLTCGTAPGNDLVLTDDTISRYHLELRRHGDRIAVVDHGSTNGTIYAGAHVVTAEVPAGSTLTLGRTKLVVQDADPVVVELHDDQRLAGLIGKSSEMRTSMAQIKRVAPTGASVLVLGETGTGKEVVARALHELGPRAKGPFETVDCAAMMPNLIASELFGHEKGAFTSADSQHVGAFERADGGTIFLDEIGELPASLQISLLGALERRSFRRLGGQKPIKVDVRVIAATNRDLRAEVNAGTFRQDLYYRLAVVLLRIPPLRERPGDLALLIDHFLREGGYDGDREDLFPGEVLDELKAHRWPGNVRELRNLVEAAIAMGEAPDLAGGESARVPEGDEEETWRGDEEAPEEVSIEDGAAAPPRAASAVGGGRVEPYSEARARVLQVFEAEYLSRLHSHTRGNVSAAAREAKMNRQHLIRMLKRHGIK